MSYISTTISGNIGSVNPKVIASSGKTVLEVSVCHNQYEGRDQSGNAINKPIWIKAIFWDDQANLVMDRLHKGGLKGLVVISGKFEVREYVAANGTPGISYELKSPVLLDFIAKKNGEQPQHATDDEF